MAERNAVHDMAICNAATSGPWLTKMDTNRIVMANPPENSGRVFGYGAGSDFICDLDDSEYHQYRSPAELRANLEFIAMAREALPYWIQEAERNLQRAQKILAVVNAVSAYPFKLSDFD